MACGTGGKRVASSSETPENRERAYWKEMMEMLKAMIDKLIYPGSSNIQSQTSRVFPSSSILAIMPSSSMLTLHSCSPLAGLIFLGSRLQEVKPLRTMRLINKDHSKGGVVGKICSLMLISSQSTQICISSWKVWQSMHRIQVDVVERREKSKMSFMLKLSIRKDQFNWSCHWSWPRVHFTSLA